MRAGRVYELIAAAVAAEEVGAVFAVTGDGNMKWLHALADAGAARIHYARHEGAAAAMAEGYARAGGGLGLCSVTCGPGLTLTATTLVIASRNRTPFLLVAGEAPLLDRFYNQSFDQRRFAETCECAYQQLRSPATAAEDVQAAFAVARTGQPVILGAAFDLQDEELPEERPDYRPALELVGPRQAIRPDEAVLERAVELLAAARRPAIIAGRGAAGARREIERLAEVTGALLATTLMSKGLFEGHPNDVGICGNLGPARARALLGEADCVLGIGASLNQYTTSKGGVFPQATVIQVGLEPWELIDGRRLPVDTLAGTAVADLYVQGEAGATVAALLARLPAGGGSDWGPVLERVEAPEPSGQPAANSDGLIHPREAMRELSAAADERTLFVIGLGHFWWFPTNFLDGRDSSCFQYTSEFGAIGQGLGSAIGAAVAHPGRPVVLVEGDASLTMVLQELDTAVRYGLDLVVVVMNDGGLGAEFHKLEAWGWRPDSSRIEPPDFAAVARALGARGERVDRVEDVAGAVRELQAAGGPGVVDVRISPQVVSDQYWNAHFATREVTR